MHQIVVLQSLGKRECAAIYGLYSEIRGIIGIGILRIFIRNGRGRGGIDSGGAGTETGTGSDSPGIDSAGEAERFSGEMPSTEQPTKIEPAASTERIRKRTATISDVLL